MTAPSSTGLIRQNGFSVSFDFDFVPPCVVRLSLETRDPDKVLDLVFSFHNSHLDHAIEYVLQALVKLLGMKPSAKSTNVYPLQLSLQGQVSVFEPFEKSLLFIEPEQH